jgi:hypothetical protein
LYWLQHPLLVLIEYEKKVTGRKVIGQKYYSGEDTGNILKMRRASKIGNQPVSDALIAEETLLPEL